MSDQTPDPTAANADSTDGVNHTDRTTDVRDTDGVPGTDTAAETASSGSSGSPDSSDGSDDAAEAPAESAAPQVFPVDPQSPAPSAGSDDSPVASQLPHDAVTDHTTSGVDTASPAPADAPTNSDATLLPDPAAPDNAATESDAPNSDTGLLPDPAAPGNEPTPEHVTPAPAPAPAPAPSDAAVAAAPHPAVVPTPVRPAPTAPVPAPPPGVSAATVTPATATPAQAAAVHPTAPAQTGPPSRSTEFGRVADDGTVFVRTPEGEKEVGSYPGAPAEEALAYFARKYDEVYAIAELLFQRVTQTDLSGREAAENLAKLRTAATDLHAVGDLVALAAKIETIATAVEARRSVENEQRAVARKEAQARREQIVAEAEAIASQPEPKIQWKASSARMRALLDEWKAAQGGGPKLDRESEQALWHRLSSSRNSFDKLRRVHFAQLSSTQTEAKAAKEELIAQAEALATSTDWGATAGAFKQLMDRWRHAGRAARADDDALWARFKAAQDSFFAAKDAVSAAENEEFKANLVVKEELLTQAQALLPVRDIERTKSALRGIQDKWEAAGKVPRSDLERIERAMRKVEQTVRDAEDKKWKRTDPEVAARAASLASQAEAALEKYRRDLEKAEKSGNAAKIAKATEALETRQAWLAQAQRLTDSGD